MRAAESSLPSIFSEPHPGSFRSVRWSNVGRPRFGSDSTGRWSNVDRSRFCSDFKAFRGSSPSGMTEDRIFHCDLFCSCIVVNKVIAREKKGECPHDTAAVACFFFFEEHFCAGYGTSGDGFSTFVNWTNLDWR